MENNLTKTLNKITQNWFLSEPLLFSVFCSHEIVPNDKLCVPFRTGKMRIEYCPQILQSMKINEIAEYLKIEVFRILLKHPYQRQPTGAKKACLSIASDAVIHTTYVTDVKLEGIDIMREIIIRNKMMAHGFSHKTKYASTESSKYAVSTPLRIPASIITDYLKRIETTKVEEVEDGFKVKIDKEEFFYQLETDVEPGNDPYYQVMKFNNLLLRYENVYGVGIKNFWENKARIGYDGNIILPRDLCYEEWYSKILMGIELVSEEGEEKFNDGHEQGQSGNSKNREISRNMDNLSQLSELWDEDEQTQEKINNLINDAEKSQEWGSISGNLKELIQANKKVDVNYEDILRHFSTSIISSRRNLTRMKPNRRFGFDRLGSRYNLNSNLLIAVDVSSSITMENLEYVFSIINQFFRYGVEQIDVIQFDSQLQGNVVEMKKALEYVQLNGRGGTDFQPVADFYSKHKEYDGLIFFTDGYGNHPEFVGRLNPAVLWIFTNKTNYQQGKKWIDEIPGNNATFVPLP